MGAERPPVTAFDVDEAAMLAAAEDATGFLHQRSRALVALVARHGAAGAMWDVGAGTGGVAAALQRAGRTVVAVEPSPEAARWSAQRGVTTLCAELQALDLPSRSLAGVSAFDVLEHLADADGAVAEVARVLDDGGTFFVSVPAGRHLWSEMDDLAGHHWRASPRRLLDLVVPHGFEPIELRHWGAVGVPAVLALRVVPYRLGRRHTQEEALALAASELGRSSPFSDAVLRWGLAVEEPVRRWLPRGLGTSILAAFRRTGHGTAGDAAAPTGAVRPTTSRS